MDAITYREQVSNTSYLSNDIRSLRYSDFIILSFSQCEIFKSIPFTELQRNRALSILNFLVNKDLKNKAYLDFIPTSINLLIELFGIKSARKKTELNKLVKSGLIIEDATYRPPQKLANGKIIRGTCKGYRLNYDLVSDSFDILYFKDVSKKRKYSRDKVEAGQRNTLRQLKLKDGYNKKDFLKSGGILDNLVTDEYVCSRLQFNEEIPGKRIKIESREGANFYDRGELLEWAKEEGVTIVRKDRRNTAHRMSREEFLSKSKHRIKVLYANALFKIIEGTDIYADTNQVNFRLDSNFTCLAGSRTVNGKYYPALIDFFQLDGEEILTLDLSNSQMAFGMLLMYHEVGSTISEIENGLPVSALWVLDFCESIQEMKQLQCRIPHLMQLKDFYTYIQNAIKTKYQNISRDRVKKMMFEILFSSHRNNSEEKQLLRIVFPEFVAFADSFKKRSIKKLEEMKIKRPKQFKKLIDQRRKLNEKEPKNWAYKLGDAQFSVYLQRTEAKIFIDVIAKELTDKKYKFLSKHDSISFKASRLHQIRAIIEKHLNEKIGKGLYNLRLEKAQGNKTPFVE